MSTTGTAPPAIYRRLSTPPPVPVAPSPTGTVTSVADAAEPPPLHVPPDGHAVALTFDACGGPQLRYDEALVEVLRRNYCGNVGLEYMHIADIEERRFLQERMEGRDKGVSFTAEGKQAIREHFQRFWSEKRDPALVLNAHYLTSEQIHVDGDEAEGQWIHMQPWLFGDGSALLRSSRLNNAFRRDEGRWRITRTRTENVFIAPLPDGFAESHPSALVLMG